MHDTDRHQGHTSSCYCKQNMVEEICRYIVVIKMSASVTHIFRINCQTIFIFLVQSIPTFILSQNLFQVDRLYEYISF